MVTEYFAQSGLKEQGINSLFTASGCNVRTRTHRLQKMKPLHFSIDFEAVVELIQKHLSAEISELPEGFHDTFAFTRTGSNYCHSITLSLIGDAIKQVPYVKYVGFDVRFNRGKGAKFQPDVVGFDRALTPVIYADFESPNSSDARLIKKDIDAYKRFAAVEADAKATAPYLIITSLPNRTSKDWECRWTSPGYWNHGHAERLKVLRANPFQYWTKHWRSQLSSPLIEPIAFLNINGAKVERFRLSEPLLSK